MREEDNITSKECKAFRKDFMNEVKDIKDAVNDLRVDIAALPEKLLEKSDERYAGIRVEKIVYGTAGLMLSLLITAIVYLVLK